MSKSDAETLRSSWTLDGQRIYLLFSAGQYRLATRWVWLASFKQLAEAAVAFEALEMLEGDPKALAGHIRTEIRRRPDHQFGSRRHGMGRIAYLVRCVDNRMAGLRLRIQGSKGSVEAWA